MSKVPGILSLPWRQAADASLEAIERSRNILLVARGEDWHAMAIEEPRYRLESARYESQMLTRNNRS